MPAPAPKAVPAPAAAPVPTAAAAPGVVKAPTTEGKPAAGGTPDGAAKTMFGMPAVSAAALAGAEAKSQEKAGDADSEVDAKKTMLGMAAASPDNVDKPEEKDTSEEKAAKETKKEEKKAEPEKKKAPRSALDTRDDDLAEEPSAKKGIIIGAAIGIVILLILAVILFSGD